MKRTRIIRSAALLGASLLIAPLAAAQQNTKPLALEVTFKLGDLQKTFKLDLTLPEPSTPAAPAQVLIEPKPVEEVIPPYPHERATPVPEEPAAPVPMPHERATPVPEAQTLPAPEAQTMPVPEERVIVPDFSQSMNALREIAGRLQNYRAAAALGLKGLSQRVQPQPAPKSASPAVARKLWLAAGAVADEWLSVGRDCARTLASLKAPEAQTNDPIEDQPQAEAPKQSTFWGICVSSRTSH
jgi:hypothetical protein